jgi:hypothetical protein
MLEISWWFVGCAIWDPFVLRKPKDIVQGWIIGLTTIRLNVCPKVYAWIIDCIDPHVAWVRLQTRYQSINNVEDKLSNLRLHDGDLLLYFRHIQEIQLEFQGINQCVPKVDVVE